MGLFSTLGKIVGGVVGLVPGVGSVVGGLIAKGGELLDAKKAMTKVKPLPVSVRDASRYISGWGGSATLAGSLPVLRSSTAILRASPVLPGGAVATANGPTPQSSATPPSTFGGRRKTRRKAKRSRRASSRRRTTKRKLKFGSAAYRKKYLGARR